MEEQTPSTTESKGMNPILGIIAVVAILIIGAGAMFALNNKSKNTPTPTPNQTQTVTPEATITGEKMGVTDTAKEEKTFTIEAGSFYYNPKTITVKKGTKVKIVMTSKDMMHDFNIDELNVKMPITKAGETNTVEFVADKVGKFEYYCSVGQHRQNGQVGTLTVTE